MNRVRSTSSRTFAQRWPRFVAVAFAAVAALALSGCYAGYGAGVGYYDGGYATAGVGLDVPVIAVGAVPTYYSSLPRYYYNGSYVYLQGDSWYYPRGNSWYRLRSEPSELARYRSSYAGRYYGPSYRGRAAPGYAYPAGRSPGYAYPGGDRYYAPSGRYRTNPGVQRGYTPGRPSYQAPSRGYDRGGGGRGYYPR